SCTGKARTLSSSDVRIFSIRTFRSFLAGPTEGRFAARSRRDLGGASLVDTSRAFRRVLTGDHPVVLKGLYPRWLQRLARMPRTRIRRFRSDLTGIQPLEVRTLLSVSVVNNAGQGYAGLSFNQSGGYVPPDTNGAAGPNAYVETVNQTVALYPNKSTGAGAITDSLSHFFVTTGNLSNADSGAGFSDPV